MLYISSLGRLGRLIVMLTFSAIVQAFNREPKRSCILWA